MPNATDPPTHQTPDQLPHYSMATTSEEISRFNSFAADWWQPDGRMAMLHAMHPARMQFITRQLRHLAHPADGNAKQLPRQNLWRMLDIGCGGGITAESLARLGHTVTAVDAAEDLITIAQEHARQQQLTIDYRIREWTDQAPTLEEYDMVTALEIIEHVVNPAAFLQTAMQCVRPGGILVVSTINRTLKSRLAAIGLAEYILRLLPVGTHDWSSFVKPSEITAALPQAKLLAIAGMLPDGGMRRWRLVSQRVAVNYIIALQKEA